MPAEDGDEFTVVIASKGRGSAIYECLVHTFKSKKVLFFLCAGTVAALHRRARLHGRMTSRNGRYVYLQVDRGYLLKN